MFEITNDFSEVLYHNISYAGIVMSFIDRQYFNNSKLNQYHMVSNVLITVSTRSNGLVINRYIHQLQTSKKV